MLKRSLLQQKKEECNAIIRDLGFLPDEAFEKYNSYSLEKLLRRLHRANEKLKKFSHVNKKASEQYGRFTKQREQLKSRKAELDHTHESIGALIDSLDRRKNEAIERTFHNVAGNFAKIFELLVPAGKGELVMRSDVSVLYLVFFSALPMTYTYDRVKIWMLMVVLAHQWIAIVVFQSRLVPEFLFKLRNTDCETNLY